VTTAKKPGPAPRAAQKRSAFSVSLQMTGIRIEQVHPEIGAQAYDSWTSKPDRHPY
jgi:hypothetical protein